MLLNHVWGESEGTLGQFECFGVFESGCLRVCHAADSAVPYVQNQPQTCQDFGLDWIWKYL